MNKSILFLLLISCASLFAASGPVSYNTVTRNTSPIDLNYRMNSLQVDAGSLFVGNFDIGATGVRLSTDNDGAVTFQGLGNGADENFTLNLDDTANTVVVSTTTGLSVFDFATANISISMYSLTLVSSAVFPDNVRQTFNPGVDSAGFNVGSSAAAPGTPSNGDAYYDSTLNQWRVYANGAWVNVGAAAANWAASGTTNSTLPGIAYVFSLEVTNNATITGVLSIGSGNGQIDLGTTGVRMTSNGDGEIRFLSLGDGSDEDLALDLDDTANTVAVSSSTGVTKVDFGTINVEVPADPYDSGWNGDDTAPTKNDVYDKIETISGGGLATNALWQAFGIGRKRLIIVMPNASGLNNVGDGASAFAGTQSVSAPDSNQPQGLNYVSTGASGDDAGIAGSALLRFTDGQQLAVTGRLIQTNAVRAWVAVTSTSGATQVGSSDPAADYFGFRYLDSIGTTWFACTDDGTTQTAADTGIQASTAVTHFAVDFIPGVSATFYINGTSVRTNTTNLPDLATGSRWMIGVETQEAVAKDVRFYGAQVISTPHP